MAGRGGFVGDRLRSFGASWSGCPQDDSLRMTVEASLRTKGCALHFVELPPGKFTRGEPQLET